MEDEKKSDIINVWGIVKEYTAKWYWFALSVVVCCALGYIYSKVKKPEYEVKANIILASPASLGSSELKSVSSLLGGNSSAEDEVEIVSSHTVLREVARELGLNIVHLDRPAPLVARLMTSEYPIEVLPAINPDTLRTPLTFTVRINSKGEASIKVKAKGDNIYKEKGVKLPHIVRIPYGDFAVETTPDYRPGKSVKNAIVVTNYDVAAEDLRGQINVGLANKHSQIISMQMLTDNVDYACQVLNSMIEKYNNRAYQEQINQSNTTLDFLHDRLLATKAELDSAADAIADYKYNIGIIDISKDEEALKEKMRATEDLLTTQEVSIRMQKTILQMLEQSTNDNSLIPQLESKILSPQIDAYNNALIARMQLEQSAKGDNPSLKRVDEQIATLRQNLLSTLHNSIGRAEKMKAEYEQQYAQAAGRVDVLPAQEVNYKAKVREYGISEQMYLFLLHKQDETSMLMQNIRPKGTIIDEAYSLNEDKSTSLKMILAMCFVLGLCIPPAVIYIKKQLLHKHK